LGAAGQCCEICFSPYAELDDAQGNPLALHLRNEMVFCSGCDMLVHQGCYGGSIQEQVPEGDWTCQACLAGCKDRVQCVLCPVPWGPVKPTDDGRWAHIACMHFVAETEAGDACAQEPVINIQDVPEKRFEMTCFVCGSNEGACVQCEHQTGRGKKNKSNKASKGKGFCNRAFHVGCAAYIDPDKAQTKGRFFMEVREMPNQQVPFPCASFREALLAAPLVLHSTLFTSGTHVRGVSLCRCTISRCARCMRQATLKSIMRLPLLCRPQLAANG